MTAVRACFVFDCKQQTVNSEQPNPESVAVRGSRAKKVLEVNAQKVRSQVDAERSHYHRGFSPVTTAGDHELFNRFNGFRRPFKPLKRLRKREAAFSTGLKPRC